MNRGGNRENEYLYLLWSILGVNLTLLDDPSGRAVG